MAILGCNAFLCNVIQEIGGHFMGFQARADFQTANEHQKLNMVLFDNGFKQLCT